MSTADLYDPWSTEPKRHPVLKAASLKPYNAETPASLLVESFITPKWVYRSLIFQENLDYIYRDIYFGTFDFQPCLGLKKYHKNKRHSCIILNIITKILQNVCLINTHVLMYWQVRCDRKLWYAPRFWCFFKEFLLYIHASIHVWSFIISPQNFINTYILVC